MSTENDAEHHQTRAMTEAQCREEEARNQEQAQGVTPPPATGQETSNAGTPNPAMNPTVNLHKPEEEIIREFVMKECTIGLDWYVPNFCNIQVADLIKERLPIETTRDKILFNCPPLREFFPTTTFELELTTGRVYTYLMPLEDIGVPCQWEKFNLDL